MRRWIFPSFEEEYHSDLLKSEKIVDWMLEYYVETLDDILLGIKEREIEN